MTQFLSTHEPAFRLAAFVAVLASMALWELAAPRRAPSMPRWRRWPTNLALSAIGTLLVRIVVPLVAAAAAVEAARRGIGLFNWIGAPAAVAIPLSMIALDLLIYAQHVVFHRLGFLWRLHRIHHADPDVDVTTGIRFHPVEILISMGVKILAVALLGAPVVAVVLFEVLLNAAAMFNHSNVRLPVAADRILRRIVVTPDMHRVHHSVHQDEHDMNFGFSLSIWDRLFGTYRAQPRDGHEAMRIGLLAYPAPAPAGLGWSLVNPFSGAVERGEKRI
ncbi:MAG: sterol desaturase family protein [Parvibaculum sp.]|uniref:sterol desaturase family protein n=1 Tax=Parvibaculum sp. TaxID=2024848 RepID=UPI00271B5134|nr:sterol desaturase family protein [Parvibaculum sp.]MDO8839011.1 sterol desaturase family protein [Parvibaculum sp.]